MKTIVTIFSVLLLSCAYAQDTICKRDTSFHSNGNISSVYDFNEEEWKRCGYYSEYDTLGNLLQEGTLELVDSVLCKDCYYDDGDGMYELEYSYIRELHIGEWIFYHSNGRVKERGHYSKYVHQYSGERFPIVPDGKGIRIYTKAEPLKEGTWEYYDEKGFNYMSRQYHLGVMMYQTERY